MGTGALVGAVATVLALVVFLAWTYHELRRIDRFAPNSDEDDR